MSNWAIIMAGGVGSRFWPASRRARPKQLLPLAGGTTSLLASTVSRIADLVPPERIIIVTGESLADATAAAVPNVPRENILAEPTGRNTAPCVGWGAAFAARKDPEATLMVLPADHHIGDVPAYLHTLGVGLAAAAEGDLVTVGLAPTRPETGYGYIELGDALDGEASGAAEINRVYRSKRFVEKPDRARAEEFLAAGRFLWNSGMFFFRASAVLSTIADHLPELSTQLKRYDEAAARGQEAELVKATYGQLPSISVDHGIMEKAVRVLVVPGSFGWSDLGSFTTAWELADKDAEGNAVPAEAVLVDANGCYASSREGKVVAMIGVKDLVVVDTEDALLIVPRDQAQRVREVVAALKERGDPRL